MPVINQPQLLDGFNYVEIAGGGDGDALCPYLKARTGNSWRYVKPDT